MAGPRRQRPISLRRFIPALALLVVGLVVLAVGGDTVTADAIALALMGVAAVVAVAVVFFEIGASEDRDRRAGRS
jgi:tellurite resistance protein TehA-like permease